MELVRMLAELHPYWWILGAVVGMGLLGALDRLVYPHGAYDNRLQGTGTWYTLSRTHKGGSGG